MLLNPLHQDPRWQDYLQRRGISDAQLAGIELEVKLHERGDSVTRASA